jgi:ATP-dependent Clp protease ATP-binding subunit ClpA
MPKINVYLPDDLARAVREAGIPVSAVCQRALADAVAAADGHAPSEDSNPESEASDRPPYRLTQRADRVLTIASERAAREHRAISSPDLVEGLLEEGNNLALVVLRSLDVDPQDLLAETRATVSTGLRGRGGRPDADLSEDVLAGVKQRSTEEARALGHNYIGCEHLLLALVGGPEDDPATASLKTLGVDLDNTRSAVRAALNGVAFAQGHLSFSGLSAPVRSVLEEIRQRLSRLEQSGD